MAEGFWARYLKDLLKFFPYGNDVEIRHEGAVETHSIRSLRRLALKKIPEKLLIEHRLMKTLRYEDMAEKKGMKADEAGWLLGFNTGEQILIGVSKIERLERTLIKIRRKHPSLGEDIDRAEIKFQEALDRGFFLGEKGERGLYLKLNDVVMKVAERSNTDPTVMETLMLLAKKKEDVSSFARWGFRFSSIKARKAITRLGSEDVRMERLFLRLEHEKIERKKAAAVLNDLFKKMVEDLHMMFENTYKLWRRDFLQEIVLLRLLDETEKMEIRSIQQHTAPRAPTEKNIQDIQEIKKGIAQHAHFLAQEFRILLSKEKSVQRNIEIERELAKRGLVLARRKGAKVKKVAA